MDNATPSIYLTLELRVRRKLNKQGSAIINGDRIELSFDYDLPTIELIRGIDGRKWDEPKHPGVWSLPVTAWHSEQVCRVLPDFYIDPTIKFMAEGEKVKPRIQLPKELYKFQKEGVKYIASVKGRCIIADDMGLGKSAEALVFLRYFTGGKVLIVSPANVTFKWAEVECPRWWPGKSVEVITSGKGDLPDVDILVMSYAIMVNRYDELKTMPFMSIVLDEAHYVKSPKAMRTKVAKTLVHAGIQHVLLLSGTPFMNNPGELFSLLNLLDPVGFSNYYSYAIKYCGAFKSDGMWLFPKDVVTNRDELEGRLKRYMIRRTKQEVELELPELTRSYVPIELGSKGEYKKALEEFRGLQKGRKNYANTLVQLTKLRQIIGREKVEAAVELAENVLEAGRKVVIFAHHKEIVSLLEKSLRKYGVGIISGDTKAEDRQRQADIFLLDNPKIRCMIITVAGAEGINLYSASDIIFAEREYTPAREEQAEARLHRIGQKQNVTAYYIVVKGTIDERMNTIVKRKREVIGQIISQDEILESILDEL
jgi:SWI/SNF-related matrix-associated actin-dependent regulator 1 of chromatin subfamily A